MEIGAASGAVEDQHLDAAVFQQPAAVGGGSGSGQHQQIAGGAACHFGIERQAQLGIHHDAQQRAGSRQAGAVGEQAIVGQQGADSGKDGVVIVTQFLYVSARPLAGDPALVVVGRRDLSV